MQATAVFQSTRPALAVRPARKAVVVQAAQRPEVRDQASMTHNLGFYHASVLAYIGVNEDRCVIPSIHDRSGTCLSTMVAFIPVDLVISVLQAPKQQKVALAALAAFAAAVLVNAAPANAADVKTVVCSSNPTAKLCLKNSAKQ